MGPRLRSVAGKKSRWSIVSLGRGSLVSGEMAAKHILEGKTPEDYQEALWKALGPELTNSFRMQKMSRRAWLLNWFVGKASKKPAIQEMMTEMIASKEAQENLHSPWFMFKTLMF